MGVAKINFVQIGLLQTISNKKLTTEPTPTLWCEGGVTQEEFSLQMSQFHTISHKRFCIFTFLATIWALMRHLDSLQIIALRTPGHSLPNEINSGYCLDTQISSKKFPDNFWTPPHCPECWVLSRYILGVQVPVQTNVCMHKGKHA